MTAAPCDAESCGTPGRTPQLSPWCEVRLDSPLPPQAPWLCTVVDGRRQRHLHREHLVPVKRAELATPAALPSANALCGASSESGHRHDGQPPEQTQAGVLVNRRPLVVVGGGAGRGEEWGRGSRVTAKPRRGFWVRCDLTLPLLSPQKTCQ